MLRPVTITVLATLACPGAIAHAATVSSSFQPGGSGKGETPYYSLAYAGSPGEKNTLTLTRDAQSVTFNDSTAPLTTSGTDCSRTDDHTVRCAQARTESGVPVGATLTVSLGDGDDRSDVSNSGIFVTLAGGDGNDTLTGSSLDGGAGDDVLTGTNGADYVITGLGRDMVSTGDGDDRVVATEGPGQESSDQLDGGAGIDEITSTGTIDLSDAQPSGSAAAPDTIKGFENATGGEGPDVLIGNDEANVLYGMSGADVVRGGGGNDTLLGGAGADTVEGGAGDDLFFGGADIGLDDGAFDEFSCGDGRDFVKYAWRDDFIGADCEALDNTRYPREATTLPFNPHPVRTSGGRVLTWRLRCATKCKPRASLSVLVGGQRRVVAKLRATKARKGNVPVVIKLTPAQLRTLRRASNQRMRVEIVGSGDAVYSFTVATTG